MATRRRPTNRAVRSPGLRTGSRRTCSPRRQTWPCPTRLKRLRSLAAATTAEENRRPARSGPWAARESSIGSKRTLDRAAHCRGVGAGHCFGQDLFKLQARSERVERVTNIVFGSLLCLSLGDGGLHCWLLRTMTIAATREHHGGGSDDPGLDCHEEVGLPAMINPMLINPLLLGSQYWRADGRSGNAARLRFPHHLLDLVAGSVPDDRVAASGMMLRGAFAEGARVAVEQADFGGSGEQQRLLLRRRQPVPPLLRAPSPEAEQ